MGRKRNNSNYNQNLLEHQKNLKEMVISECSLNKYCAKYLKYFPISSFSTTKNNGDLRKKNNDLCTNFRAEHQKAFSGYNVCNAKCTQIVLRRCEDNFEIYETLNTVKEVLKTFTPSKFIKNTKSELKEKEILGKEKIFDCDNQFQASISVKKAVVILKRCEGIQERSISKSYNNSKTIFLEESEKVNKVPNKSGTKRKRKSENSSESKSTKSTNQKKSDQVSNNSKKFIPDVTAFDFSNDSKSSKGSLWNFKISSWNVNGIRAWLEKNGLSYLHHEQPDIMCIQETKCSDDKLPKEVKEIEGYHSYWLSGDKDGYSGVGLLTKEKPIKVEYGIGVSEHDNEGRVITAEYDKFYLVSTYVPNAGRGLVRLDYRMKWDKDFQTYLKKLDAIKPVILCGDLNVAHKEIDLANPKTNKKNAGFTKEEREDFSNLLNEGFIDTFRHLYPDLKGAYTFWTYMMNARAKNVGWRLDYFVISERFSESLCDNVIRKDIFGSDHCPITLFLSL